MIVIAAQMFRTRSGEGDPAVRISRETAQRLVPPLIGYGFAVGTASGFFGIGGGFLVVPGILAATRMPLIAAIGSSLVSVTAFGVTTAINYAVSGLVDWRLPASFSLAASSANSLAGARSSGSPVRNARFRSYSLWSSPRLDSTSSIAGYAISRAPRSRCV